MKRFFKDKFHIRATSIIIVLVLMFELVAATVTALTYYTVKINYLYIDGTPAHDPYIATYNPGTVLKEDVTNPTLSGFQPMALSDPNNDPADLPTGGVSAEKTHIQTASINGDIIKTVYYVAGLTHYAARYYLQNIYDDLYTLDRDRTNANQNRLGQTGTTPDDLESEKIPGFTSLFHEPDAIAADGSTVFRVYYDRNYYSVNFDLGEDGYGVEPIYAKYESVYRLDDPKRLGYTFLGWARTDNDSSKGEEGTDWRYLKPDAEPEIDDKGVYHYDENDYYENETQARLNLVQFKDKDDLTVPAYNSYYKAIWTPGTTHFTVMYWIENEDNDGYTALLAKDVYQTKENNQMVDVHAGTTVDSSTVIRNYAEKAHQEGVYNSSTGCKNNVNITDLFSFNLNYADPDNALNEDPDPDDPDYDPDAFVYKYDTSGVPIDFKDISKGTSDELAGCGDFFELNTSENTSDSRYITDTSVSVRGDGTTRFNVFFKRKTFTLKFYYARQGYTNGALDPNKFSLTNSTKQFNFQADEAKYLNTTSKNVLEAIAKGSWSPNLADSLPTVKDEYKQIVTEGYDDFVDKSGGYYRYYYYQVQAKYNEPLKDKWLIDALNSVHRKGAAEKEICLPGSIATEYYNKYYQDRASSPNYTVKGVYEKLGKGILFTDSARNTMKQLGKDYTELHFLISWTNTHDSNGWNSSIENVLHFRYENYTELLPREIEILEHDGTQALLNEGNYTSVREFTTKVKNDAGNLVSKTKWYGLSTNHVYETIDSGNQYNYISDPSKRSNNNNAVYTNQTATDMTGFELEYLRKDKGFIKLDEYNTEIDWSQDKKSYRRAIIKFFYRRLEYTLKYRNGNHKDESRTRTVMYGAPINSTYQVSENGHEAGDYRYYWPDPEYFDKNRRNFFTFEGWYNDPRYEEPFDLDTQTMPADDDTLFAKWSPKSIDVIFYDDYDDFYSDRKGQHPENRVVLGKDKNNQDITDINVDYGSYVPLMSIPVNGNDPDIPRPKLKPIAEGASFAGWYYIRNRVPVRFEPENVPITALNEESVGDNAKLRLFAEWVTKDVAKYKVKYVKAEDNNVEIAPPTTGRAYVWKTKTFNAKSGDELYDEYKWTQEGDQEGTNWWPTTNSSSMVIKANNSDDEYAPNNIKFEYIQKGKVHYKVQYLDAATRKPLNVEGEDVIKESTHASVTEDAKIIPGYIVRTATQSLTLTASNADTPEEQQAEELQNNVITFLYDQNKNEYMYEVEYLTQDLGANTYSVHSSETLTVEKTGDGAVNLSVADLYNKEIPKYIEDSGYTRVSGETKYNVTNAEGVRDNTPISVADDGTVEITGNDKKTIMIYFNRISYRYQYQYIDQSAEKAYLENLKNDPNNTAGKWNGVMRTFEKDSNENYFTGQVGQEITINPDKDYTYHNQTTGENTDYTRVTNENGELNPVKLTIQPENNWNVVKIYYRKDIERELHYKMVCVNNNSETDYYEDGTPKFGRLNFTMQTVLGYDGIKNNTFSSTNKECVDVERKEPLHLHRYTFLGWYTTPTYDEKHPETNRITTNATLTKEDLPTGSDLPENKTKYYALVKQDMVKMDVMFYYVDDYTVNEFRADKGDDKLAARIQAAIDNKDNDSVADKDKVHLTGEHVGKKVTFTAPNGFKNHNEIPWHLNDGYTLNMDDIDERAYKYEFAEWWSINEDNNKKLTRHDNWNSPGGWNPDQLSQQLARNKDQYLIAVYARRDDVTSLPYKINYNYTDRTGEERTFVKKGTLSGDKLNESSESCKITNDGYYRLTNEFILANAPYESNHRQTITWSDAEGYISSTSEKNTSGSGPVGSLIAAATAKQPKKQVYAHYRTTADGDYTTINAEVGDNYELNDEMRKIVAEETDSNGCKFSYWAVRKSEEGDVIAKGKRTQFDLCLLDDNYWISPVYEAAPRGSGDYTATLDRTQLVTDNPEDWLAWTFDDGAANGEGEWVRPDGMTFRGLKEKVIFVRLAVGATPDSTWSNVWNQTYDLDVIDGRTFNLNGFDESHKMIGSWTETPADEPSIKLTHIKYNRNRWTDDEGEIASSGDTDLLYTDFEIAFADNEKIQHSDEYQLGVVFELCATLPESATFDPSRDYNQVSDPDNLGDAILGALDDGKNSGSYVYNTAKPHKTRNFQLSTISTSDITNRDRVEFAKAYKNAYRATGEGTIQYTNSNQLMKATAYIVKDGKVTLSNSVYICLKAEAQKDLAVGNMPVETSGSTGN